MEKETQQEGGPDPLNAKMPLGTKICILVLILTLIIYALGCNDNNQIKSTIPLNTSEDSLNYNEGKWGSKHYTN